MNLEINHLHHFLQAAGKSPQPRREEIWYSFPFNPRGEPRVEKEGEMKCCRRVKVAGVPEVFVCIWGNTLCLQIVPCSCPYEALWRVVRHSFLSLPRKESEDDVVLNMRITQRNHDKINKIINLTVHGVFTFKRSKPRRDLCYIFHLTYCQIFPSSSNPLKCY